MLGYWAMMSISDANAAHEHPLRVAHKGTRSVGWQARRQGVQVLLDLHVLKLCIFKLM